jgi:hypothetical protein
MFETIERLLDPDDKMDSKTAKAVADLGSVIVESARLELDVLKLTSNLPQNIGGTGFLLSDFVPEKSHE